MIKLLMSNSRMVKKKTIEEALKITNRAVAEVLKELFPMKMHRFALAEDTLKLVIEDYLAKKAVKK